ncbi:MAG: transcription termination/antitermination NusG family protein [Pseudomonadota bacterium]
MKLGRAENLATEDTVITSGCPFTVRYPQGRALEEDVGLWWVIHTKPNCERHVANYLMHREISYYLPAGIEKTRYGNMGKIRVYRVPVFRGYVCVALDKQDHQKLYDTKKLIRLIEVSNQVRFVEELGAVARAAEISEDFTLRSGLARGTRVRILNGPLRGLEGVVIKSRTGKELALSVTMFNQSVSMKLDPSTELELM